MPKHYKKYNNGGNVGTLLNFLGSYGGGNQSNNPVDILSLLKGDSTLAEFLRSDAGKELGKKALATGAGLLEKNRTKKALLANQENLLEAAMEQYRAGRMSADKADKDIRTRGVSTETLDAAQGKKEVGEELLKADERQADKTRSDLASAAASGDPRAAARLQNIVENQRAGNLDARTKSLAYKTDALQDIATATEKERDLITRLDSDKLERGLAAADEGRKSALDAQTAMASAGPLSTGAGIETGSAFYNLLKDYVPGNPGTQAKDGMRYMADQGFKTKGEFDHGTNKKAVIDEENGEKEAELTGGELVFNPKQVSQMENLIEDGKANELLQFMRELLAQPQFQD